MFVRYALHNNVSRFLVVNSEISEIFNNIIIEVRNDVYFENIFSFKSRVPSDTSCILSTSNTSSTSDIPSFSSAPPTDTELKRSKRTKILRDFREDFFTYLVEGNPCSFKEAIDSSDFSFWKKAIDNEIKFIMENNT